MEPDIGLEPVMRITNQTDLQTETITVNGLQKTCHVVVKQQPFGFLVSVHGAGLNFQQVSRGLFLDWP